MSDAGDGRDLPVFHGSSHHFKVATADGCCCSRTRPVTPDPSATTSTINPTKFANQGYSLTPEAITPGAWLLSRNTSSAAAGGVSLLL
jgi:hypothetical protein